METSVTNRLQKTADGYTCDGIALVMSCASHPEQYDAVRDGMEVGYLRLRHGHFYAQCPRCELDDPDCPIVYSADPAGDGEFDDEEREVYLVAAIDAIKAWLEANPTRELRPWKPC